jgi:hypothetical protein
MRESLCPNGRTLACGLVGPWLESRLGECREVAQTYFTYSVQNYQALEWVRLLYLEKDWNGFER